MKQYSIFVGLKDSSMKALINRDIVINETAKVLSSVGVDGFNLADVDGYWKGLREPSLIFSFVNTFGVTDDILFKLVGDLKVLFNQECILITSADVTETFI